MEKKVIYIIGCLLLILAFSKTATANDGERVQCPPSFEEYYWYEEALIKRQLAHVYLNFNAALSVDPNEVLGLFIDSIAHINKCKKFKNLKYLVIKFDNLRERDFENIPNLSSLQYLRIEGLESYQVFKPIPHEKLKKLSFKFNALVLGSKAFQSLSDLEELTIESDNFISLPENIGDLRKLKRLTIRGSSSSYRKDALSRINYYKPLPLSRLQSFPLSLSALTNLEYFEVRSESLLDMDFDTLEFNFPKLTTLVLASPLLIALPGTIFKL